MGVIRRQAWSKSQWTVKKLSQQMLNAIKHTTDDNFFFQEDRTVALCM